jgi:hypothetical protein
MLDDCMTVMMYGATTNLDYCEERENGKGIDNAVISGCVGSILLELDM